MQNSAERLSDRELALLSDVGQAPARYCEAGLRPAFKRLHAAGFVQRCDDEAPIYALTEKGFAALNARRVLAEA
jgi:hypothetical protein